MARYINEDEFVAWVKEHWCADCQNDNGLRCRACWIDDAIDIVEEAPEADIVPRSEVGKAIDDLKRYVILNENISKKCKAENGDQNVEYWKGKLSAFLQVRGYIDAELKKKYTEQKNG